MRAEPLLHTNITDELPKDHPLANVALWCKRCGCMIHASVNECMASWAETDAGNYCLICLVALDEDTGLEEVRK
jgi:hypothetical protein